MNQKGFSPLFIVLGIILVIGIAGGAYYLSRSTTPKPPPAPVVTSQIPQSTLIPSPADKIANLKIFTLENITFKYPSGWSDPDYVKTSFGQSAEIKNQDSSQRIVVLSGINKGYTEQKLSQFINSLIATGGEKLALDDSEAVKVTSIRRGAKVSTIYVTSKDKTSQYSISLEVSQSYSDQEINEILNQIVSTFKFTQ